MKHNIKDVARHAGVSIATVSRALNAPHLVRPGTREAIQQAIAELEFQPNLLGRQLRTDKTGLIGVMLPTLSNPVFAECLQGMEERAAASGYRLMVMTTSYQAEREQRALETLLHQRVDGLVLTVAHAERNPMLDRLAAAGTPHVLVYNHCESRPCVAVDNCRAARDGVQLLLARGHRRIRMLTGSLAASDRAAQRHQGYCQALEAAGLEAPPAIEIDFNSETLPDEVAALLARPDTRPDALFCGNDRLAMLVMRSLARRGLRVPRDIAILGFDGLAVGELLSPPLASVSQPNFDIGALAVSTLDAWLQGFPADSARILPHGLRHGGSIASP
ncbi:LacI family transcriptional regulator [Chromobacterium sphagni]|uniref:LacI family transcriptional regulator n=1 Tax=Chromobacterium sphagni TaxID=1903179 RepID=A0A1S1X1F9_9NEIS|nr:LacI family DNA-binding transcriptional regulator [Chromobacterium sphagni]OHX13367.1 LacI family transcriptional regulator [Chromobacterium sphagni]